METLGIEVARRRLPELVTAAQAGQATVISRHGRPSAAIVPITALDQLQNGSRAALLQLKGCAPGVWGPEPGRTLAELRDEWNP